MDHIFSRPHQIGLKLIGAWPGYAQLSGFLFAQGWPSVLIIFAVWDIVQVYGNLDLLLDNMVNTIAVVVSVIKLTVFRVKRRYIKLCMTDFVRNSNF